MDDIEGMVLGRGQHEIEEELFEEAEEDIDRYIQIREFQPEGSESSNGTLAKRIYDRSVINA